MPDHEVDIVLIAHLDRQFLVHQIVVNILRNVARLVPRREKRVEIPLHIGVLRRYFGISSGHVVVTAVRAGHVGDVPDGIGTRRILQRAATQGIGIAQRMGGRPIGLDPLAVPEDRGIERHAVLLLANVLGFQVAVRNGIQQARTVDADGRFEAHAHLGIGHLALGADQRHVIGVLGDRHFGIDQAVRLAVGKLIAPLVGILLPADHDLRFVDRGFERRHGPRLRHTGERCQVIVVLVGDDQQIAVADLVGVERAFDTLAVAVARVAVQARGADIERPEAVAHTRRVGREGFFEQRLAVQETLRHRGVVIDDRRRLLVGHRRGVESRAELAAGVILLGNGVGIRIGGGIRPLVISARGSHQGCRHAQAVNQVLFHC